MKNQDKKTFRIADYILMIVIGIVHFSPFYVLLNMCLKKKTDMSSRWKMPNYLYFDNFKRAWNHSDIPQALLNTFIITLCSVILIVVVGSFAAYPLARRKSKFNNAISRLSMLIMMVPPLTILVPLYSTMVKFHGISTFWGIIALNVTFQLPLSIYLFTNFIRSIPSALDEAALIDGCGYGRAFFNIILPQMKPVIASVTILCGVTCWNDYTFSLYILQSPAKRTLTLVVSSFFGQSSSDLNGAAAVALIAVLPMLLIYILLQKYFVQGMVDSAVK